MEFLAICGLHPKRTALAHFSSSIPKSPLSSRANHLWQFAQLKYSQDKKYFWLHTKVMKKSFPFLGTNLDIFEWKKYMLFTLQINGIYWKRPARIVAFQRMFGILEQRISNRVTPLLANRYIAKDPIFYSLKFLILICHLRHSQM